MKPTLTIYTPTYNRAYCIRKCYESLCRQTSNDFVWLVVDDGSNDNTREVIKEFITDRKIDIIYLYQMNRGMHSAHNYALQHIDTELNVCIDSDDYMPDNAVELICDFWKKNKNEKYAGFIGLNKAEKGDIIGQEFPKWMKDTTLIGYYEGGGSGDKKLVYRTDIIKSYPEYPIFEGEKYVGLAYKYYLVDKEYKLLVFNKVLCIVDYQMDGSSINMYSQYILNPKGFAFFRKTKMQVVSSHKRRFIECTHYVSSSILSKNKYFLKETPYKLTTLAAIPFGIILTLFIKYKVNTKSKMKKPQ